MSKKKKTEDLRAAAKEDLKSNVATHFPKVPELAGLVGSLRELAEQLEAGVAPDPSDIEAVRNETTAATWNPIIVTGRATSKDGSRVTVASLQSPISTSRPVRHLHAIGKAIGRELNASTPDAAKIRAQADLLERLSPTAEADISPSPLVSVTDVAKLFNRDKEAVRKWIKKLAPPPEPEESPNRKNAHAYRLNDWRRAALMGDCANNVEKLDKFAVDKPLRNR